MTNIILCGFKGSGKSTLGKAIADEIGYSFVDTDHLIAKDCKDFYQKFGESAFRQAEKKAISSLHTLQKTVVATGGGSILDPDNVVVFKKIGVVIYLKEEKTLIKNRLLKEPYPAFFLGKDLEREFEEMYARRKGLYERVAGHIAHSEKDVWEVIHLELFCKSRHGESLMAKQWEL